MLLIVSNYLQSIARSLHHISLTPDSDQSFLFLSLLLNYREVLLKFQALLLIEFFNHELTNIQASRLFLSFIWFACLRIYLLHLLHTMASLLSNYTDSLKVCPTSKVLPFVQLSHFWPRNSILSFNQKILK